MQLRGKQGRNKQADIQTERALMTEPQRGAEVRPLHNQPDSMFTNDNFSSHGVCLRVSVSPSVSFPADLKKKKNTHKALPWLLELLLQLAGDKNAGRPYVDVLYGLPSNTAQYQGELVWGKWGKNPGKKKPSSSWGSNFQTPDVTTTFICTNKHNHHGLMQPSDPQETDMLPPKDAGSFVEN